MELWDVTNPMKQDVGVNRGNASAARPPVAVTGRKRSFVSTANAPTLNWSRECFSKANKDLHHLKCVYEASQRQLQKRSQDGDVALASFRRGGCNRHHQLLHEVDDILTKQTVNEEQFEATAAGYTHYQSGHENTLFGFVQSEEYFAIETSAGKRACDTEEATEEYKDLNMPIHWYIEWLVVLHYIYTHGGLLVGRVLVLLV
jgi:hypothetical protein